ncbi:MAG: hypothetical protein DMG80_14155 [Acidobacteria bacterium]|jgi:hypothetical protein|nr:MAG: hypothetical protein DMG80_14155 [Acidobacteriota bacterium]
MKLKWIFALTLFAAIASASRATTVTISGIDDYNHSGWSGCTNPSCSGGFGHAAFGVANITGGAPYTIDGSSLRFDLIDNGTCPNHTNCYSNALFWYVLNQPVNQTNAATAITLDFYAMMDSAGSNNSEAAEFTVNQVVCTASCGTANETLTRYIYSMQCDFKNTGVWKIWDGQDQGPPSHGSWVPTNHNCVPFQPNSFNHFVMHFTRPNSNQIHYVDFQINGTTYPLNINAQPEIWPNTNAPSKFEASAQLDGDYFGHGYSLWIDKWIISYTY